MNDKERELLELLTKVYNEHITYIYGGKYDPELWEKVREVVRGKDE